MAQLRTSLINHVSDKGTECIEIVVHCAFNIGDPGIVPKSYVKAYV